MTHEDELRRLLRGGPIPTEDEQLAQALRELRSTLSAPPSEDVARRHLSAITAEATEAAHEAPTPQPVGRLRRWGRRVAAAGALKVATVATVAAAATGGGFAATGNLPQPVQQQVSDVLSQVGITVPSGTETSAEEQPDDLGTTPADEAVVESAPPEGTPPVETPAADPEQPADAPEERPTEDPTTTDDEAVPFEETPTGEPSETPSDAGEGDDAPAPDDAPEERSGSADAYRADDGAAGAEDEPGSAD